MRNYYGRAVRHGAVERGREAGNQKKKLNFAEKGIKLKNNRKCGITILTAKGPATFSRTALKGATEADNGRLFSETGSRSLFPLDEHLGLDALPYKMTPAAMLMCAKESAKGLSFAKGVEGLRERGLNVSESRSREAALAVGAVVGDACGRAASELYERLISGKLEFPRSKKNAVLYIELDGSMINTNKEAEAKEKKEDSPDKGGKKSTWREVKLCVVFSTDKMHSWKTKNGEMRHAIIKKECAAHLGSAEEFRPLAFDCAWRAGYGSCAETVVISDGAAWISNFAADLFPDATHILDQIHVIENVNNFAKAYFSASEWKKRADSTVEDIKAGKAKKVVKELDDPKKFDKEKMKECGTNLLTYLRNHLKMVDYPIFVKKGYFIGSGAVESANKAVAQSRLKTVGMRWDKDCAEHMLALKAKTESGSWHDVETIFLENFMHYKKVYIENEKGVSTQSKLVRIT
jgi:hypothetical protein